MHVRHIIMYVTSTKNKQTIICTVLLTLKQSDLKGGDIIIVKV